jgi:hypothetical protein
MERLQATLQTETEAAKDQTPDSSTEESENES